jgi:hypothetical protein
MDIQLPTKPVAGKPEWQMFFQLALPIPVGFPAWISWEQEMIIAQNSDYLSM